MRERLSEQIHHRDEEDKGRGSPAKRDETDHTQIKIQRARKIPLKADFGKGRSPRTEKLDTRSGNTEVKGILASSCGRGASDYTSLKRAENRKYNSKWEENMEHGLQVFN